MYAKTFLQELMKTRRSLKNAEYEPAKVKGDDIRSAETFKLLFVPMCVKTGYVFTESAEGPKISEIMFPTLGLIGRKRKSTVLAMGQLFRRETKPAQEDPLWRGKGRQRLLAAACSTHVHWPSRIQEGMFQQKTGTCAVFAELGTFLLG